ncbi:elongation factor G, mitochondrial-like [Montipora capricornis]|uniref:elongation factor G, mitochondrial-like n=1 Tax=Montipora capricornis TaxID=246305 RepID=UPI0035F11D19
MPEDKITEIDFVDATVGMNIPKNFIPSIEKGFQEVCERGLITGHKLAGIRFILEDGAAHGVDSSELAFKLAAIGATMREAFPKATLLFWNRSCQSKSTFLKSFSHKLRVLKKRARHEVCSVTQIAPRK